MIACDHSPADDKSHICAGVEEAHPQSPDFWSRAFHLRRDEKELLLCPELLQAVAEDVLEAGKASLLLQSEQRYSIPAGRELSVVYLLGIQLVPLSAWQCGALEAAMLLFPAGAMQRSLHSFARRAGHCTRKCYIG
jgi:hypothetical protein